MSHRGLAFLLSLGSLPLACSSKDDDTDSDGSTSSTGGTTGAPPTTGATDPTTGSSGTTSGGSMTGQTETGTSSPTTGVDTDTGGAADPICVAYGEHYASCFPPRYGIYADILVENCEYNKAFAAMDGPACVEAFDAYFVCVTNLDCAEILNEESEICPEEDNAILAACPSIEGPDTTGGTGDTGG